MGSVLIFTVRLFTPSRADGRYDVRSYNALLHTRTIQGNQILKLINTYSVVHNKSPFIYWPFHTWPLSYSAQDLRDGDRFFYTNPGQFTRVQLATIKEMTLSSVLCAIADRPHELWLPPNSFKVWTTYVTFGYKQWFICLRGTGWRFLSIFPPSEPCVDTVSFKRF